MKKDERSKELQKEHFAEVLEIVQYSRKYNIVQFQEKLGCGNISSLRRYFNRQELPRQAAKKKLLKRMGELLHEEKRVNTLVHGRIYL